MFKKFLFFVMAIVTMMSMSSCHMVTPDADEEAVLIYKPWFFGHGGVDDTPVQTGLTWCCASTSSETFKITPQRYDVDFDDIMSNDNTPLDYATYITLQITPGKSPILMKNYGVDWFKNNIEVVYRNFVREEISKYSPFDLMSNREVCTQIDTAVKNKLVTHIQNLSKKKEFPVEVREVITGRAKPNDKQLAEMNNTAAAIQARQTQQRLAEKEEARKKAEIARAEADKAYMKEMNLSPEQFIMLKIVDKANPNVDIVLGGGTNSMWNIRRGDK
jgi:regulator of protease activity HflC (stomatin/prohibitin superfamily)